MSRGNERWARLSQRWARFPTERDWERSVVLRGRPAPYEPELVSDGAGLPFAPSALTKPAALLDPGDPAVGALAAQLGRQRPAADGSRPSLHDWRMLARSESEVLFGKGLPPHMITVAMHREGRRENWRSVAVTTAGTLRRTRDGIRASSWQLDPTHPPAPEDTLIRMLVTEQTRSGGALADKRLLEPDLHEGDGEVLVTMFVAPRPGIQVPVASATPATPVRVQLPSPIGERLLLDASRYEPERRPR